MNRYIYILLIVILSSCSNKKKELDLHFLKNYANGIAEFPTDLTDHFPNEIKAERQLSVSYPSGVYAVGMANVILSHKVDTLEFKKITQKLRLNNFKAYNPKDSIFIIVGDSLDYSKKIDGIPIPNFNSYERDFGINDKYLPDYHKIYVLESKSGEYLKKENLSDGKNLPTKWKNGFSRGIATNEKENELIYWICAW